METKFNNLDIDITSLLKINYKNCSYCNKPFIEELWCKECDPFRRMQGWTSGNPDIDKFIKDTMHKPEYNEFISRYTFIEWVPFDRFIDIKEIGEGGFAKVYSAIWIDGPSVYHKNYNGKYQKERPKPMKIALKRLNGSQNISNKYLNELKIHWNLYKIYGLNLYGLTKDPETKEFMMIIRFADKGSLRNFGLSGPASEQNSGDKIYGVLPYIAPEVLNGEPYTSSSDIYSLGVIMTELSSGILPFYNKKHDLSLALEICNGLRPKFGKGTPEFYKKLAYRCMNANSNERPTAIELVKILKFWYNSIICINKKEEFGYKGKEIEAAFKQADKEISNILALHKKNPDAVYVSRAFTFSNLLSKPVNSSIITSYIDNEESDCRDSQLGDLEISDSIQF
ncbi:kinase-like domain-containing protein [Rhizophagus clarus]|uniref:Kinase-like domain-containing protein n=1 Tax=Rhizophagus clarus TaxID=94130 RepID=A0A8H3KRI3_9GLOM|nr:kinase-like domain-containing protein [Rhizophagus clarus]